jgi:dephospho-CoA kinase
MLRVGLTGSLGSGKSTVAKMLRALGAEVIEADELGRALMEPGQAVFAAIIEHFGAEVVGPDGRLNRARLAELVFQDQSQSGSGNRLQELNAIIHPAVIAAQQAWMREVFARNPAAVAVVESALIFEVERDARVRGESETVLSNWRRRMDRVVVVTAPEVVKIARFTSRVSPTGEARSAAEADARRRLAHQIPDAVKAANSDYVIDNSGDIENLRTQVEALWPRLQAESNKFSPAESLE